jgi:putative peptidoglycan lipid II flippase
MSKYEKAAKSVSIIALFLLLSKILGLIRESLIAAKFGMGTQTDIFFIAITVITLIVILVQKSLNTTLIPVLAESELQGGKLGKQKSTVNILNVVILSSLFLLLIGWFLAPIIVSLIAIGFDTEAKLFTIELVRLGLPVILIAGISGVLRGYLQSEERFLETGATYIPYNVVYIVFLLFFANLYGLVGLMIASVLAVLSQLLIQLPGIKKTRLKYRATIDLKDQNLKTIGIMIPPVIISVIVADINQMVDKAMASTLVEGSISALSYATRLQGIVLGVFTVAISTVMFPILAKAAKSGVKGELVKNMNLGVNMIMLITIPATVGIVILSEPLTRLVFERGLFDSEATKLTSSAFTFYSLGLLALALKPFLKSVYYSLNDTKTPMINGIITVFLNVIFNILLIGQLGHAGIALATSLSTSITVLILVFGLRKRLGEIGKSSLVCLIKVIISSGVMGLVVYNFYNFFEENVHNIFRIELFLLICTVTIGMFTYVLMVQLLKIKESNSLIKLIKKKLRMT